MITRLLLIPALTFGLEAAPAPGELIKKPFSVAGSEGKTVLVEQCDGSRSSTDTMPSEKRCERWTVEWTTRGKAWGVTSADSHAAVTKKRDQILGFARQYARYFGRPFDPRFGSPTPAICDACRSADEKGTSGLFGDGQRFGGIPAQRALGEASTKLSALETALFDKHMPHLKDVARLAKARATARFARAHAKNLEAALRDLARVNLELENAAVFRSAASIAKATKKLDARATSLDKSHAALLGAVAKEIARAHGGRYSEDNSTATPTPQLHVELSGTSATLTYEQGPAKSTWFEGEVKLNGSVGGHSLVAPAGKGLKCNDHTAECGYVKVPSVVRFSERKGADGKKRQVAELWFQQKQWVRAKPFSR